MTVAPARRDGGMATAELAVVLPVLVLLVAAGMTAISVLVGQLRCVDAAREGARAAARGEEVGVVTAVAQRSGPSGAAVEVAAGEADVQVTVSASVGAPGGPLPTFRVRASAVAVREPETSGVP